MLNKLVWGKSDKQRQDLQERISEISNEEVPAHIAIIMDGNGRWAKKRALPRVAGHREAMKNIRKITKAANIIGVKAITLYAFSTENWKRPRKEVEFLMRLPEEFLGSFLPELMDLNIRVEMIGEADALPRYTQLAVQKAMDQTKNNTGMILNFALNYGSRKELSLAMQRIAKKVQDGDLNIEDIAEDKIASELMTSKLPDPDLLIRTSGEFRLSNFMLWQLAYTEFWFTDILWPDFDEHAFFDAISDYQKRDRRFGGLKGE